MEQNEASTVNILPEEQNERGCNGERVNFMISIGLFLYLFALMDIMAYFILGIDITGIHLSSLMLFVCGFIIHSVIFVCYIIKQRKRRNMTQRDDE